MGEIKLKSTKREQKMVNRVVKRHFKDIDLVDEYFKYCGEHHFDERAIYNTSNICSFAFHYAESLIHPGDRVEFKYSRWDNDYEVDYKFDKKWHRLDMWYPLSEFISAYICYKIIKSYVVSLSDGSQITTEAKDSDLAELSVQPIVRLRNGARPDDDKLTVYTVTELVYPDRPLICGIWRHRTRPIQNWFYGIEAKIRGCSRYDLMLNRLNSR